MKNRIFLGGTCANSTWRDTIEKGVNVDMFNPVVDEWTEDARAIEDDEKENKCNIHLYVLTSLMVGSFSVAEVVNSAHDNKKTTILQVLPDGFNKFKLKSLQATVDLVRSLGAIAYVDDDLNRTVKLLNNAFK